MPIKFVKCITVFVYTPICANCRYLCNFVEMYSQVLLHALLILYRWFLKNLFLPTCGEQVGDNTTGNCSKRCDYKD